MIQEYIIGRDKIELTLKQKETNGNNYSDTGSGNATLDLFLINKSNFCPYYSDGNFFLKHVPNSLPAMYELSYDVTHHGTRLGTLYLNSRLNSQFINLKVDNELCYHEAEFNKVMHEFMLAFSLELNNISALDIFIDCRVNLIETFNAYFFNPKEYHFITGNRTIVKDEKDTNVYAFMPLLRNGIENKTYYIGNKKKTGKQICLYNKTKELQKSKKHYISSLHDEYLTGTGDVYRCELRLTNKYLSTKKKYTVGLEDIFDPDYLKSIFESNLSRFLDFRKVDAPRPTRCTKVVLFDFTLAKKVVMVSKQGNNDSGKTIMVKKQKKIIKNLIEVALYNNSYRDLMECNRMAESFNLTDYYKQQTKGIKLRKYTPVQDITTGRSIF